jgi:hypothetical protein
MYVCYTLGNFLCCRVCRDLYYIILYGTYRYREENFLGPDSGLRARIAKGKISTEQVELDCTGGWCLFPAPQRKTFPSHPFLHSKLPSTSPPYRPSSYCLTTSSPSDFLRPVPRSLVPPSLLLSCSCAPLCCPCIAHTVA